MAFCSKACAETSHYMACSNAVHEPPYLLEGDINGHDEKMDFELVCLIKGSDGGDSDSRKPKDGVLKIIDTIEIPLRREMIPLDGESTRSTRGLPFMTWFEFYYRSEHRLALQQSRTKFGVTEFLCFHCNCSIPLDGPAPRLSTVASMVGDQKHLKMFSILATVCPKMSCARKTDKYLQSLIPTQNMVRARPMDRVGDCNVCEAVPEVGVPWQKCPSCKLRRYCSKKCQKADWKQHKETCKPLLPPLLVDSDPESGDDTAGMQGIETEDD
jgi:hypothetical protein